MGIAPVLILVLSTQRILSKAKGFDNSGKSAGFCVCERVFDFTIHNVWEYQLE